MDIRLATFASELTKIAAKKEKKDNYLKQVASAAPFAVASAISDVPKGMVDKYVEQAIVKAPGTSSSLRRGLGRGAGRLTAGLATSPVFLSGIKDLQSDSEKDKKRGMAKVVGSGLAYSALKGGIESGIENYKTDPSKIWKKVRATAGARGIVGAASAALTAAAVAKATKAPKVSQAKKSKKPKKQGVGQYVAPAISGGIIGAGKGAFESVYAKGLRVKPKALLGATAGRAASGALGAAAMTHLVKSMMPKTAEAKQKKDVYSDVRSWSRNRNDVDIYKFYKEINQDNQGERSPSRRAAYYALGDELSSRGYEVPKGKMRNQVVNEKVKNVGVAETAGLVLVAGAPGAVWATLGDMPPDAKDRLLEDALDRMFIDKKLNRIEVAADKQSAYEIGTKNVYLAAKGKARPETVAHEIGHAAAGPLRKATIGSATARKMQTYGSAAAVAIPVLVFDGATGKRFATRQELEDRAKFLERFGAVAGLAQAPVLMEEAKASIDAVDLMRRAGSKSPKVRALRHLLPAYATYAVPAAVPFLAAAHLRAKARRAKKVQR